MTVQLSVSGTQSDVTAISRVTVSDPLSVTSISFHVIGRNRRRVGPLPPDRVLTGGVYEKDLLLDPIELTRVQVEAALTDGSVMLSQYTAFGTRFEPIAATPGILTSIGVTPAPSRLDIAAVRGSAFIWKCYAKNGGQPTIGLDGNPGTTLDTLDETFLRFNEIDIEPPDPSPHLSFSMAANPGTWNVIAVGFNSAGQQGPRRSATVQVTS